MHEVKSTPAKYTGVIIATVTSLYTIYGVTLSWPSLDSGLRLGLGLELGLGGSYFLMHEFSSWHGQIFVSSSNLKISVAFHAPKRLRGRLAAHDTELSMVLTLLHARCVPQMTLCTSGLPPRTPRKQDGYFMVSTIVIVCISQSQLIWYP